MLLSPAVHDMSFDDQRYHHRTVPGIASDWKPFGSVPNDGPHAVWINGYTKGSRLWAAVFPSFGLSLELGKSPRFVLAAAMAAPAPTSQCRRTSSAIRERSLRLLMERSMGIVGGGLGYSLLRLIAPRNRDNGDPGAEPGSHTTTEKYFGSDFFDLIRGKTVIDFGCGVGEQAVELARRGAEKVIGLDIQEHLLTRARLRAEQQGVSDRCVFAQHTNEVADVIVSKDAFEHFSDPAAVLRAMSSLLKQDGYVLAAFGPTWLHPYGGHLFSVFPWSHLVFSEEAQIRWRADFKDDGANSFSEVAGGLSQLTIARFEKIVGESPLRFALLETVPIRGLRILKSGMLREIGTSIVRCKLVRKSLAG